MWDRPELTRRARSSEITPAQRLTSKGVSSRDRPTSTRFARALTDPQLSASYAHSGERPQARHACGPSARSAAEPPLDDPTRGAPRQTPIHCVENKEPKCHDRSADQPRYNSVSDNSSL